MSSSKSRSARTSKRDSTDDIYENVEIDIDRIRCDSRGSVSTEGSSGASSFTRTNSFSTVNSFSGANNLPSTGLNDDRPPKTPTKLKLTSSSNQSRHSGGSAKYSYDEVSVNFGKPVILGPEKSKISSDDDIFGNVTFQSPIEDMSVETKEMIFSAANSTVKAKDMPVPAPRPSKGQTTAKEDSSDDEKIYEDPDEVMGKSNLKRINSAPPDVPPRNFIISNNNKEIERHKDNSYENVYCEVNVIGSNADKSKFLHVHVVRRVGVRL